MDVITSLLRFLEKKSQPRLFRKGNREVSTFNLGGVSLEDTFNERRSRASTVSPAQVLDRVEAHARRTVRTVLPRSSRDESCASTERCPRS